MMATLVTPSHFQALCDMRSTSLTVLTGCEATLSLRWCSMCSTRPSALNSAVGTS